MSTEKHVFGITALRTAKQCQQCFKKMSPGDLTAYKNNGLKGFWCMSCAEGALGTDYGVGTNEKAPAEAEANQQSSTVTHMSHREDPILTRRLSNLISLVENLETRLDRIEMKIDRLNGDRHLQPVRD